MQYEYLSEARVGGCMYVCVYVCIYRLISDGISISSIMQMTSRGQVRAERRAHSESIAKSQARRTSGDRNRNCSFDGNLNFKYINL